MSRSPWVRRGAFAFGLAALAVALAVVLLSGGGHIRTENAYVKADKLTLAPELISMVEAVYVVANQPVKKGDLLVKLDDHPYRLEVAEAEARVAQARNDIEAKRAEYAEAAAEVERAREDVDYYSRELERAEKLGSLAVSESQLDQARQALKRARALIRINEQRQSSLRAELGGDPDMPIEEQANYRFARAELASARYKVSRMELRAPRDGIIANDVPQVGEAAMAGLPLITMLATDDIWVEANLKETQLAKVRPGQTATVTVDAYPGRSFTAVVDTLSAASGSEFALIPPQNASGNWVKVIQRIPVRLRLTLPDDAPVLRAGMSAEVDISVAAERGALRLARDAAGVGGPLARAP
jgi:membrane fusion protein (multidrug efflux system)